VRALQLVRAQLDHPQVDLPDRVVQVAEQQLAGHRVGSVQRVGRDSGHPLAQRGPAVPAATVRLGGHVVRAVVVSVIAQEGGANPVLVAPVRGYALPAKWGVRRPLGGQLHRGAPPLCRRLHRISDASRRGPRGEEPVMGNLSTPAPETDVVTLIGKQGNRYLCPDIAAVDRYLAELSQRTRHLKSRFPQLARVFRADIDLLLERRIALARDIQSETIRTGPLATIS